MARSIARPLGLNEDLTEAIALGHDLGHTPFGHEGERALSRCLARWRGIDPEEGVSRRLFAHNEQGARIVELIEREGRGLNLTQEVVDGIRCHSGGLRAMTAEGRVVGLADRVAYVAHDIDDAKRAGLLCEEDLPTDACEVLGHSSSERIERMVRDVVERTEASGEVGMTPEVWRSMMGLQGPSSLRTSTRLAEAVGGPRPAGSSRSSSRTSAPALARSPGSIGSMTPTPRRSRLQTSSPE